MSTSALRRALCVIAPTVVALLGVLPAPADASVDWSTVASPNAQSTYADLASVSCSSASACTAVGIGPAGATAGTATPLAERWDGSSWSVQNVPFPSGVTSASLVAVSCPAQNSCWAVGNGSAVLGAMFAEHWSGGAWSVSAIPDPSGYSRDSVTGISCVSDTDCTVVGWGEDNSTAPLPVIEHWDGSAWSQQSPDPLPSGSGSLVVSGVACVPGDAGDRCALAGYYNDPTNGTVPLVEGENWSGEPSGWHAQGPMTIPSGGAAGELTGIACPSATACVATGNYWDPTLAGGSMSGFAEAWNGNWNNAWTLQNMPTLTDAFARAVSVGPVSCNSPSSCTTLGNYSPGGAWAAVHWNGSSWTQQTTDTAATNFATGYPQAISCPAGSAQCTAAGFYYDNAQYGGADINQALAEQWDGSAWSSTGPVTPPGQLGSDQLQSVSCVSTTSCAAVGFEGSGNWELPIAEVWDGTSWTLRHATSPNADPGWVRSRLNSVSCATASFCVAVGYSNYGSGGDQPLIERWDGSTWTRDTSTIPTPSGVPGQFMAVSCWAVNACMALAQYSGGNGQMSERWNGSSWTASTIPTPSGGSSVQPTALSCSSDGTCMAVGTYTSVPNGQLNGVYAPVAERWDGSQWTASTPPMPNGVTGADLNGVSCGSSGMCMAVGRAFTGSTDGPLAVEWISGAGWSDAAAAGPSGGGAAGLESVSCASTTACTAVGYSGVFTNALAENWNGSGWTTQTPDPGAAGTLYGVSCPDSASATHCIAAGASSDGHTLVQADGITSSTPSNLAVSMAGTGTGTVTGNGIDCSAHDMCVDGYGTTETVTLNATPDSGSTFTGWSGGNCSGTGTCVVRMSSDQAVTATFSRSATTSTSTSLSSSANPSMTGQQVTYTATVSPIPDGGTVTFTEGGTTIFGCAAVSVNPSTGKATCNQTYGSAGSHAIRASYNGDTNYGASSSSGLDQVVQSPNVISTGTALSSSGNPSIAGQQVTFTATVSPVPDGGTVIFEDGGSSISGCGGSVNTTTGKVACTTTYTVAGSHTIQAYYTGDAGYQYSLSPTLIQIVNPSGTSGGTGGTTGGGGGSQPTQGQITVALAGGLKVTGPAATITKLLGNNGFTASFNAPGPGKLAIGWWLSAIGSARDGVSARLAKAVLIASANVVLQHGGRAKIKIKLTRQGRKLLAHAKRVALLARGSFTPVGGRAVITTKRFKLKH